MQINYRTDADMISDKVVAAMETGNFSGAREVLATYSEAFPEECAKIRREILVDYGYRI